MTNGNQGDSHPEKKLDPALVKMLEELGCGPAKEEPKQEKLTDKIVSKPITLTPSEKKPVIAQSKPKPIFPTFIRISNISVSRFVLWSWSFLVVVLCVIVFAGVNLRSVNMHSESTVFSALPKKEQNLSTSLVVKKDEIKSDSSLQQVVANPDTLSVPPSFKNKQTLTEIPVFPCSDTGRLGEKLIVSDVNHVTPSPLRVVRINPGCSLVEIGAVVTRVEGRKYRIVVIDPNIPENGATCENLSDIVSKHCTSFVKQWLSSTLLYEVYEDGFIQID
jgi:hypothetical protein